MVFLLSPGAGGAAWYWHRVVGRLTAHGDEAIAVDLPAEDETAGIEEYVAVALAALGERTDPVVVGQSLGGFTATALCERAPVRRLVLVNTMVPAAVPTTAAMLADPVRRYMLPVASDRLPGELASHPYAARDSLHEHEMWAVEGLTHRYPTKVLAELLSTCPQYCGHCTRMDLVGNSTPAVPKLKFELRPVDRQGAMLQYLRETPGVRDVVVSGGDVANLPFKNLEAFVAGLLEIESVRDIRLASKALMGLPQHWLQDDVVAGMTRLATTARERGVSLAVHTHVNAAQQVTPLVAEAARAMLAAGVRDVRNQGVLLRGVNATAPQPTGASSR